MKRFLALLCAVLLAFAAASCGEKEPDPIEPATTNAPVPQTAGLFNNGGRYVRYKGGTYYWNYWPEFIGTTGLWGNFSEEALRRSMTRLDAQGNQESLFTENGCGGIWIYNDRFYLESRDEYQHPVIYSTAIGPGGSAGEAPDRRDIGTGEIFALDEQRGLLIVSDPLGDGTYTYDTATQKQRKLGLGEAQLLLYDQASAALYYAFHESGDEGSNTVVLYRADVRADGAAGKTQEIARTDLRRYEGLEEAQFIEFDNAWLEGSSLHVYISSYGGTAYMYYGSAHLVAGKKGVMEYDAGDAPDYSRYRVNVPFDMRDIQGDDAFYGYYIRPEEGEPRQVLSMEDIARCGLPGGPYYYSEGPCAGLRDIEYVDGALFFAVTGGQRNEAEDIGWREAYDFGFITVYRKDLASGVIAELYTYDNDNL